MTRTEFLDRIEDFDDLISFCDEEGLDSFSDSIITDDRKDDIVDDYVTEEIRHSRWYDILSDLNDVATGYDYYFYNGFITDIYGIDDEFDTRRDEVLDYCIANGIIEDDEEEEYDDEEDEEEEDEEPLFNPLDPEEFRGESETDDEFYHFINDSIRTVCPVSYHTEENIEDLF